MNNADKIQSTYIDELVEQRDELRAENQQLRDALEAAQQLWDFLENEKATYEPPRELLDQGIVACETAEDYDKEERLSEALGAALAAVRVEER